MRNSVLSTTLSHHSSSAPSLPFLTPGGKWMNRTALAMPRVRIRRHNSLATTPHSPIVNSSRRTQPPSSYLPASFMSFRPNQLFVNNISSSRTSSLSLSPLDRMRPYQVAQALCTLLSRLPVSLQRLSCSRRPSDDDDENIKLGTLYLR